METTFPGSLFSEFDADSDIIPPINVFQPLQQNRRQVVMLQCNRHQRGTNALGADDPNGIVWQREFFRWLKETL